MYLFVQGLAKVLVRGLVKFVPLHLTTAKFHKTTCVHNSIATAGEMGPIKQMATVGRAYYMPIDDDFVLPPSRPSTMSRKYRRACRMKHVLSSATDGHGCSWAMSTNGGRGNQGVDWLRRGRKGKRKRVHGF